jgi:hypothetical protein
LFTFYALGTRPVSDMCGAIGARRRGAALLVTPHPRE